jgi:diguanylate cyclase (GGDEF)-like protein/PAS domain S-box-containing protein
VVARTRAGGTNSTHVDSTAPPASDAMHCLVDETGRIAWMTGTARHLFAQAPSRTRDRGAHLHDLIQSRDLTALDAWLCAAWLTRPPQPLVVHCRLPDGEARSLELRTYGRPPHGTESTILVEVREMTTPAQHAGAARLTCAVDASSDAIFLMDSDGRIEYVNRAFELLTGQASADVIGRDATVLGSARHRPELHAQMWHTLQAGQTFTGEVLNHRGDGTFYTLDVVITPVRSGDDVCHIAIARDVTDRKRIERELEDLAYYDALTGLANHRLLRERSRQILALARRHGSMAALLHVDLRRLNSINLEHGRGMGDEVLLTVAERLRQGLRESDTLARVGSDEFLVLLSEVLDEESVARVVRRLHDAVTQPLQVQDLTLLLGAHIGVALYPQDASTFEDLLECSEVALQRCKHGAVAFEFFERSISLATQDHLLLEDDLHWAWEHDQFILHYQPIIGADGQVVGAEALARGDVIGVEALARWPHVERGMVSPDQFIPLAERTGRILSLDRWAIATAARQAALWLREGWDGWISVNLSARTLHDPELPDYVARTLKAHGLGHGRLAVEITESTAMRDPAVTARVLEALRAVGVLIAVDDFGVGHSSLAYLKLFPVDLLKLDGSFVRDIGSGGREEQLVEIMISLAHRIGAKVVAEGVEEAKQMTWLQAVGCDYIQGYLVGRPAPPGGLPRPAQLVIP